MRVWFAKYDKYFICEDGFQNCSIGGKIHGYSLKLRMPKYRGIPLSCIEELHLKVDGIVVDPKDIDFCINNKRFKISELPVLYSEWWNVLDKAELYVEKKDGLQPGSHEVEVSMVRRETYMFREETQSFLRVPVKDKKQLVIGN
ncbi:MAG: DUF6379 domain-containing protein [Treponema sp.]|nr:DUF6379 domain-containing protein [Treponema sp.]